MKITVKIDGVEQDVLLSEVPKEEDGRPITHLLSSMTNGVYDIDIESYNLEKEKQANQVAKQIKLEEIEKITATVNSVEYDAHTRARADLTGVVALANYEFIKTLVEANPEFKSIYDVIYKQTTQWKGVTNEIHTVQIESVAEAGIIAYNKYAEVIGAK